MFFLTRKTFCSSDIVCEETLAHLSMAPAGLALLSHSLHLAKNCLSVFLNLATNVYSFIWPLPPPEADHQGSATKVSKPSNRKPCGSPN